MIRGARTTLFPTIAVAVTVLIVLIAAGAVVRGYVSSAFAASDYVHATRDLVAHLFRLQLDEETGVRGFAATRDREFLDPYVAANAAMDPAFALLEQRLRKLGATDAERALADARAQNAAWRRNVARPVVDHPNRDAIEIERYGKRLVDRFRSDIFSISDSLAIREARIANEARGAVDRIDAFFGIALFVVAFAAFAYVRQQIRAAAATAEAFERAEDERRERTALEAAYDAEKRVADTLQRGFAQRPLPQLSAFATSASYVPATEDSLVGGDWFDVIALANERVLFAIGDVTGHGIEAAVAMNRTRQAVITSALLDLDPATILARVNEETIAGALPLVTSIVGIADTAANEFVFSIAGHPPPILLEPGCAPRFLSCGSLPLGFAPGAEYLTERVASVPGAVLVLYTDGAIEHSRDILAGENELLAAVSEAFDRGEREAAGYIHRSIFSRRAVGDDVAILTLTFVRGGAETRPAERAFTLSG